MTCTLLPKGRIPVLLTRCPRKFSAGMPKTLLVTLIRMKHYTPCLARDQFGHQEMGTDLSPMSAVQGTPTFATPDSRFDKVHINIIIVGLLPLSWGYVYLLTCIDRFTLWSEAIYTILADITAESVARLLHGSHVLGYPQQSLLIEGDSMSLLFGSLQFTQLLGTKHLRTTAYHPISKWSH